MRKEKSWTRIQYESAYRLCRRTANQYAIWWLNTDPPEIMRAADYSIQARDHVVIAWVNRNRWSKFIDRRMVVDGWFKDLPF